MPDRSARVLISPAAVRLRTGLLIVIFGCIALPGSLRAADPLAPDEVRSIVQEILADAAARSSLLESNARAGHDGKFFVSSSDGGFRLNIGGWIQARYVLNFHDFTDPDREDGFESGFQLRRTKLSFEGHLFDPSLIFKIQGSFDRDGGVFELDDAYIGKRFEGGRSAQAGQFKVPLLREELISDTFQLTAERSLVNAVFTQERSQAVQGAWRGDHLGLTAAFSDGVRSLNSDLGDVRQQSRGMPNAGEADYALTGRLEWLLAGEWNQFRDFSSPEGAAFAAMLGLAAHAEGADGAHTDFSDGYYRMIIWTADLSLEGDGWNAYAAGVGRHSHVSGGTEAPFSGDTGLDDYGFLAQGGFFIPGTQLEPFARYELLIADTADRGVSSSQRTFNIITVGFNWFMHGHASRFTCDVLWFLDDATPLAGTTTGIPYLAGTAADQVSVRLQWQLIF